MDKQLKIRLDNILKKIKPVDEALIQMGQDYCDTLAKPLGALGKMETIYSKLYAIFNREINLEKKVVIVYVADNGIVEENISSNPQSTTYTVGENLLIGKTGLCNISKHVGSDTCIVDIGCVKDLSNGTAYKVAYGTKNFKQERSMTLYQVYDAILKGYDRTVALINDGYTLFGTGEMGVGNTTTSAAIISVLLNKDPSIVAGYGAGLTPENLKHKIEVIKEAITKHQPLNQNDVLDIVSKLGGLDMLGMVGTYLACAIYHKPFVVDGLISITGLLIATFLNHHVLDYAFGSHISTEPGYRLVQEYLNLETYLAMDMRLGEGSGCPLAFFIMENAVFTISHMPTFEEGKLNKNDYVDVRHHDI